MPGIIPKIPIDLSRFSLIPVDLSRFSLIPVDLSRFSLIFKLISYWIDSE